jgi:hypothetical protein
VYCGNDASLLLFRSTQATDLIGHRLRDPAQFLEANEPVIARFIAALADQPCDLLQKERVILDDCRVGDGLSPAQTAG